MTNEWFGVITEVRYDAGPGDDDAVIIAYKAALERQDELRTERDQQAQRIGELEGLQGGAK